MHKLRANIDLFSDGGIPIPTSESAEKLMLTLDKLVIDRSDLLFSGHGKQPKNMSIIDSNKLQDKSAEESGNREYLNSREVEVDNFLSSINDELPDYSDEITELKLSATRHYAHGNLDAVDKIKSKIKTLEQKNQIAHEQRSAKEDAFESTMSTFQERPIYYCGDSQSILMQNNEDNPLTYAVTHGSSDLSNGYLSVYQRSELLNHGAEIKMLSEATSRMDHQVLVYAENTIMEAGKLALVHCKFEFIG